MQTSEHQNPDEFSRGHSDRLLTVEDAGEKLSVSRSALYRLAKAGEISIVKIGASARFAEFDLDAFIARLREVA